MHSLNVTARVGESNGAQQQIELAGRFTIKSRISQESQSEKDNRKASERVNGCHKVTQSHSRFTIRVGCVCVALRFATIFDLFLTLFA